MIFKCKYISRETPTSTYWRTVKADTQNEAWKQALRYEKKNFILLSIKEEHDNAA